MARQKQNEWQVYFEPGYTCEALPRKRRPGKERPVGKAFVWNGAEWQIPAVYTCAQGLVTDLVMTGEDGFALLEKYSDVKFIVASELKSEVFILRALEAGAKYYLVKPVEYLLLEQRIIQATGSKNGVRMIRQKSVSEKRLTNA